MKDHFKSNEWIKNETKNAINKRDTLFQKWFSEPSNENLALYNKYRNHVTKLIRDGKIEVNQRQLGENRNPKKNNFSQHSIILIKYKELNYDLSVLCLA